MYLKKIMDSIVVTPLLREIKEHPELWNRYDLRTRGDSPHREVDDIWLRYRDYSELDEDNPESFSDWHVSQWYAAASILKSAKPLIENIFTLVGGDELGGCLITRIPPGKQVYPHTDAGRWHSEYYLCKYLLLLQSAPGQTFEFGEHKHEGEAGDLFIFDNRPVHSVVNDSDIDRISLIMAVRKNNAILQ